MFNLDEYLEFIDLVGVKVETNLNGLTTIIRHHLFAFRYQNTYLLEQGLKPVEQRQIPKFDLNSIFEQLVKKNEPGYCFQNAELLANVLTLVGFQVERHVSRGLNRPTDAIDLAKLSTCPITHMVLVVVLEDKKFLVDTGMALNSMRGVLEIKEGEQSIRTERYKMTKFTDGWLVEMATGKAWLALHQFIDKSLTPAETNAAHDDLYKSPQIIPARDNTLFFGKTRPDKRKVCLFSLDQHEGFIKSVKAGTVKTKKLKSFEEMKIAAQKFVELPDLESRISYKPQ